MSEDIRREDGELESPEEIAQHTASSAKVPFATPETLARAKELLRALAVCHTNTGLYPVTHPLVEQSITDLTGAVNGITGIGFDEVTVNVYKGTLFLENQVFPEESVTYRKLIEELLEMGISAVTFDASFSNSDATALTALFSEEKIADIEAATIFLEQQGAKAITVAETTTLEENDKEAQGKENKARAREAYDAGLQAMKDVETQAKLGKVFEVDGLQRVVNTMLDNLFTDPAAVLGLTAIKGHDDYTLNHSINVCILALSIGASLGLDSESLKSLGLSALLYDLGKVRIPEDILNKQGPLTSDEWQVVRGHTTEGADLLKRIQLVDQMPMVVAYEHHMRHDMQGYPEKPVSDEQHLFSKIVALSRRLRRHDDAATFPARDPTRQGARRAHAGSRQGVRPESHQGVRRDARHLPDGRGRPARRGLQGRRLPREQRRSAASARQGARGSRGPLVRGSRDPRPARDRSGHRDPRALDRGSGSRGRRRHRRRLAVPLAVPRGTERACPSERSSLVRPPG